MSVGGDIPRSAEDPADLQGFRRLNDVCRNPKRSNLPEPFRMTRQYNNWQFRSHAADFVAQGGAIHVREKQIKYHDVHGVDLIAQVAEFFTRGRG